MNDRYLFRAKRKNWKQLPKEMWWVEGYLYGIWERRYILWGMINDVPNMVEVDPSNICQCTGLKDKNGKLIWENDVTLRTSVTGTHKGKIIYSSDGSFCQKNFETTFENLLIHSESYFEVIGNIFDNPELLESEGQF